MMKCSLLYRCIFIGTCLVILFIIRTILYLISSTLKFSIAIDQIISMKMNNSNRCKYHQKSYLDASKSDFDIKIHEKLENCLQPEDDSRQLSDNLDFMRRSKWAIIYRRGCWSPTFSKINKQNNILIIDCPLSMLPKYGFHNRTSINQNYTGPVNIGDHEWIYTQCNLPFYSKPTIRLHFHAQPLPKISRKAKKKANVVFIQFDGLGRQTMYRRMPRSYQLLTSYGWINLSSSTMTKIRGVKAIEFRHLNVNGYNSEPDMRKLYCGSGNCQTTSLLRLFKDAGYSTSLLESYNYQLHNYIPSRVVDRILAKNYFYEYSMDTMDLYTNNSGCVTGTTWIVDQMLDYLRDRFITMRKGGWFSINNIVDSHTEDDLNNYAVMDYKFHDFLFHLNESGVLDNTILILLGDHGLHGHDWKQLWREFDHRNPFLQFLVGKNVMRFTDIIKHLEANSDKLLSHSDIYITLARFSSTSLPLVLPNAIDLFREKISDNRTCHTARIPDEWCNCWVPKLC